MVRLIDADAIEHCLVIGGRRHGKTIISEIIRRAIQAAPTVDAVPVIRCKDCKHQRKEYREDKRRKDGGYNIYWCDLVDGYAPLGFDDEYCAWAERKEECGHQ